MEQLEISIHTSAREVTKYGKKAIYHLDDFNPHFRKGSDSVGRRVELLQAYFNPHFRKGSDCRKGQDPSERYDFNPHFRKGSDGYYIDLESQIMQFQSTLPQGK